MDDSNRQISVLVVDDSPDTTETTAAVLSIAGFAVRVAGGGEEALAMAAADPPDVVLTDIRMPQIDGCALARRLSERDGNPPLLVAVTGCASAADRQRTSAAGFHLHLVKPVDPPVLIGLLDRFRITLTSGFAPPLWAEEYRQLALPEL
jgi:CheY-like chemotaxis protein